MQTLQVPTKLRSRYQFQSVIGEGGAGEVFTAWDTQLERVVAIKRLKGVEGEAAHNTWKEAMRLASVRHSNIVSVYDVGMEDEMPYVVMEYVQGETIIERVKKGWMELPDFLEFARQSLEGLIAAHNAGLVHRDIKPNNLMISIQPSGSLQVKILDFGIARFLATPREMTINLEATITGSIFCISPEQLDQKRVDFRADLYSLGCVFYYALTGEYPFKGETISEVITAHITHKVKPIQELRPEIPGPLAQFVMTLINLLPGDRYPSAVHALWALQSACVSIDPSAEMPAVPMPALARVPTRVTGPARHVPAPAERPHPITEVMISEPQPAPLQLPAPSAAPTPKSNRFLAAVAIVALIGAGIWLALPRLEQISRGRLIAGDPIASAPATPASPLPQTASTPTATPIPVAASSPTPGATVMPAAPTPTPSPNDDALFAAVPEKTATAASVSAATAGSPVPASAPVREEILRVHGSNTIGAKLLPALMEEFLKHEGATDVKCVEGATAEDCTVEARFADSPKVEVVEIAAHGSATAFTSLTGDQCDIGMASRAAKDEEAAAGRMAGLGDLRSPGCENVLGLDGVAVVVNKANKVTTLSIDQVAGIFSGQIKDWSEVGGEAGPIKLYARDDKSGTFDTFKSLVLDKGKLAPAERFEDSSALSASVAADPSGIGFIGLPYIEQAKAVAISDKGSAPLLPTRFTVATEDYPLARRLFLYTPETLKSKWTRRFLDFALSDAGQEIVSKIGFVKQGVELQSPDLSPEAQPDYVQAVQNAERLNLNFRFRAGSTQLDNKGLRDLDRVVRTLSSPQYQGRELLLLGFTDSNGPKDANKKLSKDRAHLLAQEFVKRGVAPGLVTGFGSALPVAANDTEQGRNRNRRVEVWLRQRNAAASTPIEGALPAK